jgi:segregation and condensation protein A
MKELLLAFQDLIQRAEMHSNLQMQREPLSVRQRMSEILSNLKTNDFKVFSDLFDPKEGRMGVTVTFIALLELLREFLIEVVQSDHYQPLHIRAASSVRLVDNNEQEEELNY